MQQPRGCPAAPSLTTILVARRTVQPGDHRVVAGDGWGRTEAGGTRLYGARRTSLGCFVMIKGSSRAAPLRVLGPFVPPRSFSTPPGR